MKIHSSFANAFASCEVYCIKVDFRDQEPVEIMSPNSCFPLISH